MVESGRDPPRSGRRGLDVTASSFGSARAWGYAAGIVLALVPAFLTAQEVSEPVGRAEAGKAFVSGTAVSPCVACHGREGEGGYGPDLAGTGLTFAQIRRAVRRPWGVMPAYTEAQVSDQLLADLLAYFRSLPKVPAPKTALFTGTAQELNSRAVWRVLLPASLPVLPGMSSGQQVTMQMAGCAQCHGPDMDNPRRWAGGAGADFDWLSRIVYNEGGRTVEAAKDMGTYSRARFPEQMLREVWQFMSGELGLRAFVSASADAGVVAGPNVTYSMQVRNEGIAGKGLSADDVTIALALPPQTSVVANTGDGYQGVSAVRPAGEQVATWRIPRLGPGERRQYSVTLAGSGSRAGLGSASAVRWATPAADARRPALGDSVAVTISRQQP
jgi:mono/diheme cytochrome c family protein